MQRRTVMQAGLLASCASGLMAQNEPQDTEELASIEAESQAFSRPVFIATWKFGKVACERSRDVLLTGGGSLRDAVERGINVTELDESNRTVGVGGMPNADGVVQLDACFMDGDRQQAGSVAALEGFPNPISVARRVMESTRHVMLAGDGAAQFALRSGFKPMNLVTPGAKKAWENRKAQEEAKAVDRSQDHDTISLLGCDASGHLVGGCSTSGLGFKMPGRVGDSPILGSGLYVDGEVGAAGATGVGENIMRYCATFLIVEYMRQGKSPTDACEAAIRRIAKGDDRPFSELSVNFVALNKDGHVGAAGTDEGFRAAVVSSDKSLVLKPRWVR